MRVDEFDDFLDFDEELVRALIEGGENERVEFKERLPSDAQLAKTLTAFANGQGGTLLIGVADNGELVGMANADGEQAWEHAQKVAISLGVPNISVGRMLVRDRVIGYLSVSQKPQGSTPITTAKGEIFIRVGSRNERVAPPSPRPLDAPSAPQRVFVAMSFREEEEPALVDYFGSSAFRVG